MRCFRLATLSLLAATAFAAPLSQDEKDYLTSRPTVLPGQIDASVAQAVYISQNLNSEIHRIHNTIHPLLQLHPTQYDTPAELARAFASAQTGIEALPTYSPDADSSQYIADHYAPLVAVVGDTLFLSLLDMRELSNAVLENQLYDSLIGPMDAGIYRYVLALNERFQGFGCAMSARMGADSPAGQALKVVSEQLFYLLLDNIPQGQC